MVTWNVGRRWTARAVAGTCPLPPDRRPGQDRAHPAGRGPAPDELPAWRAGLLTAGSRKEVNGGRRSRAHPVLAVGKFPLTCGSNEYGNYCPLLYQFGNKKCDSPGKCTIGSSYQFVID
jgi:hypothetical protein